MPEGRRGSFVAIRLAAVVMVLQAVAVAIFGIVELVSSHRDWGLGVATSAFFIAYGVGIGVCGWGLVDLHRWARGPTLLIELLNVGLSWNLRTGSTLGVALALAVPSIVVLICVLLPSSVEALEADGGRKVDGP